MNMEIRWNIIGSGNGNPTYEGSNGQNGTLTDEHNSFHWYSGRWEESKKPTDTTKQYITTLTSTYCVYYSTSLTDNNSDSDVKGISKETKAYKMLFEGTDETANETKNGWYWLGSSYIIAIPENVNFGVRWVGYR